MKRVVVMSAIGGCAAAGFLLSRPAGEGGMRIPSSAPAPSRSSISRNMGFIETRTHRIEMKTDGRYTIRTKGGEVLAKDVTYALCAAKCFIPLKCVVAGGRKGE